MVQLSRYSGNSGIERRDIEQIIEEPDGKVVLKFRSLSLREQPSLPGPSNYRRSFSDVSSQNLVPSQRYRFRSPIPEPIVDPPSPTSGLFLSVVNKGW